MSSPTTKELSDNIIAQLEVALNQTIPLLPKAFNRVLAKALAGIFIILYKYGDFIGLQMFVQTASFKDFTVLGVTINPLKFWGRLIGVGDPVAATQAELLIDVTVESQTGSLDSGSQLVNTANGFTYITIGSVLLDAPTVQTTIRAVSDQVDGGGTGVLGNLDPGAIVSFANPLANVARNAVVDSQVVTAADGETEAAYRQRTIDRFQKRPQGGAYADYENWGEEAAGIANVYPYTSDCPGQVDIYVEAVETLSTPDGIPTTAQLEAVLDLIILDDNGLATRRPAGALPNTFPITRLAFDVEVNGIQNVDNLAQVQADVTTAVQEYFLSRAPYIIGLSIPPRRDTVAESAVGGIVSDVVSAAGGLFISVSVELVGIQTPVYSLGIGEKAKASVSFV